VDLRISYFWLVTIYQFIDIDAGINSICKTWVRSRERQRFALRNCHGIGIQLPPPAFPAIDQ
jgi:hypothetical protein